MKPDNFFPSVTIIVAGNCDIFIVKHLAKVEKNSAMPSIGPFFFYGQDFLTPHWEKY